MNRSERATFSIAIGIAVAGLLALPGLAADPFLRRTPAVTVVEKVGPSVVSITTESLVQRSNPFRNLQMDPFNDFFRNFYGEGQETVQNLGSGVIIDEAGHVLTNEHVISRADRIQVVLADGREFEATLVGADANNDLAVLQIEKAKGLPWTPPGDSSELFVGEPVIAIGNPFGLSNTVTTGVLSAVDRSFNVGDHSYHGFLQTDASINPGNSGGPLLNAEGSLIGINSAIFGNAEGIGFAIPIDVAKRVVDELIEHGEIPPIWLGLGFQELKPALHEVMQLPKGLFGVLVTDVAEEGPAAAARLRRGDIMTRLDGRPLHSLSEFFQMLNSVLANQPLNFEIWRDNRLLNITVIASQMPERMYDELAQAFLGMKLEGDQAGGFRVASVRGNSAAARIGIVPGDRILGINGQRLLNQADLRRSLLNLRGRSRVFIMVQRGTGQYHVTLPIS